MAVQITRQPPMAIRVGKDAAHGYPVHIVGAISAPCGTIPVPHRLHLGCPKGSRYRPWPGTGAKSMKAM